VILLECISFVSWQLHIFTRHEIYFLQLAVYYYLQYTVQREGEKTFEYVLLYKVVNQIEY